MDEGRLVDDGMTRQVFTAPASDKTQEMIEAAPRFDTAESPEPLNGKTLLTVSDADVSFRDRASGQTLRAVQDLDFGLRQGETLAIVGESGSGKSSLMRGVLGLIPMHAGTVTFCGKPMAGDLRSRATETRRDLQLVFQDP